MDQRPWLKLCLSIGLQGDPGSGKGGIIMEFLGKIIEQHHVSQVTRLDHLCG